MFTGLIEAVGRVAEVDRRGSGSRLRVATSLGEALAIGESVALDGVCLTVTSRDASAFGADVSPETGRVTSLAGLVAGQTVNLERAVRADGRLGGHFVLGHVDAVAEIHTLRPDGDSHWLEVDLPASVMGGVIVKGSIAVDGVSLTVASSLGSRVGIQVVPFTMEHTTLHDATAGKKVNVETDVIGKYVAHLMAGVGVAAQPDGDRT